MKRFKVNEIIKMLEADGWYFSKQVGSHRQYKHPTKTGKVTINGKMSDTLSQELLNSIFKQAAISPLHKTSKYEKTKSNRWLGRRKLFCSVQ